MWPFKNKIDIHDPELEWLTEQHKKPLYFLRIYFSPKQSVLNPNTVNYERYEDTKNFMPSYPYTSFELAIHRAELIFKDGYWLAPNNIFHPIHTIKEIRVGWFEKDK